jgi:hypothetical protein
MCDTEITPENPVRWCDDCGEEGCKKCIVNSEADKGTCLYCADEPDEEDVSHGDSDFEDDDLGADVPGDDDSAGEDDDEDYDD